MSIARALPWILRVAWALVALAAGPALDQAFDGRSRPVQLTGSLASWAGWAVVLCATLVLLPVSLTVVRLAAPAVVVGAVAAGAAGASGGATAAAVAAGVVVSAVAFAPEVGVAFVNGPAYPNERRFPLRVPGPLLAGPLALSWVACVALPSAGALLTAAGVWALGPVLVAAGGAGAWFVGRSMHALARRWVVFVPAGVVLHDPLTLLDPIMVRRRDVVSLSLAPADTDALDLTAAAFGMALELEAREPAALALVQAGSRTPRTVQASKVLFAPTRPGAVLTEARARRID